ncbi:MAG: ubiquinone/menaquinone biosynthesis methyltransferase, partial [Verrucomicrobiota bacterium]
TGSGDLAGTVQKSCPDVSVTGVDFCLPMLRHARKRGLTDLLVADAMNLPFPDQSQDGVTIGFGLRNLSSWEDGLAEMFRVLRPGGLLVVLDFSLPRRIWLRKPYAFYLSRILPRIAGLLTGHRRAYEYLATSIDRFPSGTAMEKLIASQGFTQTRCLPQSGGIASIYTAVVPSEN